MPRTTSEQRPSRRTRIKQESSEERSISRTPERRPQFIAMPRTGAMAARYRKRGRIDRPEANTSRPRKTAVKVKPVEVKPVNRAPETRLQVFVFGTGDGGELGLGPNPAYGIDDAALAERPCFNDLLNPKDVGVVQIAVGGMHCAALTHDNRILTWGVNDCKALGRDTTTPPPTPDRAETDLHSLESTPNEVEGLSRTGHTFTQVVATDNATFVLTATGVVYGWGTFVGKDGPFGFVNENVKGRSSPTQEQLFQVEPVQVPGIKDVKELSAGANHVLALAHDGTVYAWGNGLQGELGRRPGLRQKSQGEWLIPRAINLPRKGIFRIFAGFHHNFAVDTKGFVWTWGLNNFGQTGISSEIDRFVQLPRMVDSLKNHRIAHMAGGFHHTIACTETGNALGWGRCDDAQLGIYVDSMRDLDILVDDDDKPRILTVPMVIPGLKARMVSAGIDNSLAINDKGKVFAWGFSDGYRTGLGREDSVQRPALVNNRAVEDATFTFVGCGGQFSVIAGPAAEAIVEEGNSSLRPF